MREAEKAPHKRRGKLAHAVIAAVEREHQRVASELHDGICQELVGICFSLEALTSKVGVQAGEAIRGQTEHLRRLIADTKRLAVGLTPLAVEQTGLRGALLLLQQEIQGSTCCRVTVSLDDTICGKLPREVSGNLYRIAQEATANAIQHGRASSIVISLSLQEERPLFAIEDNGCGTSESDFESGGLGLYSMNARAEWLGAGFLIKALSPRGTRVEILMTETFSHFTAHAAGT